MDEQTGSNDKLSARDRLMQGARSLGTRLGIGRSSEVISRVSLSIDLSHQGIVAKRNADLENLERAIAQDPACARSDVAITDTRSIPLSSRAILIANAIAADKEGTRSVPDHLMQGLIGDASHVMLFPDDIEDHSAEIATDGEMTDIISRAGSPGELRVRLAMALTQKEYAQQLLLLSPNTEAYDHLNQRIMQLADAQKEYQEFLVQDPITRFHGALAVLDKRIDQEGTPEQQANKHRKVAQLQSMLDASVKDVDTPRFLTGTRGSLDNFLLLLTNSRYPTYNDEKAIIEDLIKILGVVPEDFRFEDLPNFSTGENRQRQKREKNQKNPKPPTRFQVSSIPTTIPNFEASLSYSPPQKGENISVIGLAISGKGRAYDEFIASAHAHKNY